MRKFFIYFLFILSVALFGFSLSPFSRQLFINLGLMSEKVAISGTGSMYPTFPKSEGVSDKAASRQIVAEPEMKRYPEGVKLFGFNLFTRNLQRGDIVEFENDVTKKITVEKYNEESGFVKRVVALPGDEIEFRDGYFYLNGVIQLEPYINKPRSTYGGSIVLDCQKIRIPRDSVFVLGDNRKASLDSRFELGFVKINDIHHVLPIESQDQYKKNFRDTSNDLNAAHTATADSENFVSLLNKVRAQKNKPLLKLNNLLNKSGAIRAESILTKSNIGLEQSIKKSGYRNILYAELVISGYFDSAELLENLFEFPKSSSLLLSETYQDIGLAALLKDVNNCPTQAIVIHLGGYKAPDYPKANVESWRSLIENIEQILPSWKNLLGADNIDQGKLKNLISILETRLNNAKKIYEVLRSNQWLSDEETAMMNRDKSLQEEAQDLISQLNR